MFRVAVCIVGFTLVSASASAQSLFYGGGTLMADSDGQGSMNVGMFPAAGGIVGLRFNKAWSVEFHVDRGFGEGPPHTRRGGYGVDTLEDRATSGNSVFVTWKSRPLRRAAVAVFAGVSQRNFRTLQTIGVDRPQNVQPNDPLIQPRTGRTNAGGPTAGFMLPFSIGNGWSVAPELRLGVAFLSDGIYGDGVYLRVNPGVRVLWGF